MARCLRWNLSGFMTPADITRMYEQGDVTAFEAAITFIHALSDGNALTALRDLPDDLRAEVERFVANYRPRKKIIRGTNPTPKQIARVKAWIDAQSDAG